MNLGSPSVRSAQSLVASHHIRLHAFSPVVAEAFAPSSRMLHAAFQNSLKFQRRFNAMVKTPDGQIPSMNSGILKMEYSPGGLAAHTPPLHFGSMSSDIWPSILIKAWVVLQLAVSQARRLLCALRKGLVVFFIRRYFNKRPHSGWVDLQIVSYHS